MFDKSDKQFLEEKFKVVFDLKREFREFKKESNGKDEDLQKEIHLINKKMPAVFPCMLTGKDSKHNPLTRIANIENTGKTIVIILSASGAAVGIVYTLIKVFT